MTALALLSHLWLHEPDAATIARAAQELGLPPAAPEALAAAYSDVFLLNLPPYGTVFTGEAGELLGPAAEGVAEVFKASGYQPPELGEVGAPDHAGLCLGFLAFAGGARLGGADEFEARLLEWLPVCCLAVEREPSAPPFYRGLAAATRARLLAAATPRPRQNSAREPQSELLNLHAGDEVRLRDIVRFFLAPARCGLFLSRARLGKMANKLGLRLPFGTRFEVGELLFASAGEAGVFEDLLSALEAEAAAWAAEYRRWAETWPAWQPHAPLWLARAADAAGTLAQMRQMLDPAAA